jgi:hypothetical protein
MPAVEPISKLVEQRPRFLEACDGDGSQHARVHCWRLIEAPSRVSRARRCAFRRDADHEPPSGSELVGPLATSSGVREVNAVPAEVSHPARLRGPDPHDLEEDVRSTEARALLERLRHLRDAAAR